MQAELKLLQEFCPPTMFITPVDFETWNCIYICEDGLYEGGVFRLSFGFDHDYPKSPIQVRF